MVEKFPLAKANDAFGKLCDLVFRTTLTLFRRYAKWECEIQGRHNHGLASAIWSGVENSRCVDNGHYQNPDIIS